MYTSSIALETRLLLLTGEKAFCTCGRSADGTLSHCPVCRGERVEEAVFNEKAFASAILLARALNAVLESDLICERNTTTPVMPAGVYITGLSVRVGQGGAIPIVFHGRKRQIRIREIRIEEDAGRLTHSGRQTRMDYRNAGLPSVRIRTEADMEIGEEAALFLAELRSRIQYLGLASATSIDSSLRCNAHVAVHVYPEPPLHFVKLRNLNSVNFVRKAINTELLRQENLLSRGEMVEAESRIWNEKRELTESFRKRRLDAPPVFAPIRECKARSILSIMPAIDVDGVPQLPEARRKQLVERFGLAPMQAAFLAEERSRADYFEDCVKNGAPPRDTAYWLASYVLRELRERSLSLSESRLTAARLAKILVLLEKKLVNKAVCRKLIVAVLEEDRDPELLLEKNNWALISDPAVVRRLVDTVLNRYPEELSSVRAGDSKPMHFLVGAVMRESRGLAEPSVVREIMRDILSVSLVYVVSLGGSIAGIRNADGLVEAAEPSVMEKLVKDCLDELPDIRVRIEASGSRGIMSEDIQPADWAKIISLVAEIIESGTARGIVILHGTDTLSWTAPLFYWLLASAGVPIVFASSSSVASEGDSAHKSMKAALHLAAERESGVHVVFDGESFSPVNLKYCGSPGAVFSNWHGVRSLREGHSMLDTLDDVDSFVLTQILEDALHSMTVVRVYPGMRVDSLISMIDGGIRTVFLELWDSGTGCFREGPYSLRPLLVYGRKHGVHFYCTSQQEVPVVFSEFASSRDLWREGAIPMGRLTTESAMARYLAASIVADEEDERLNLMEEGAGLLE